MGRGEGGTKRRELQTAFLVTLHHQSSGAGKAPAAPQLESHLQPSSKSGAAVAAWAPTGVLGKEQEEFPQFNIECQRKCQQKIQSPCYLKIA